MIHLSFIKLKKTILQEVNNDTVFSNTSNFSILLSTTPFIIYFLSFYNYSLVISEKK